MGEIPLRNGGVALVDDSDVEWLSRFHWTRLSRPRVTDVEYAVTALTLFGARTHLRMHRLMLGLFPGDEVIVDHINRNGLDNRRVNLRFADNALNNRNRIGKKKSSSRFKGVTPRRTGRETPLRYQARITANGRLRSLGNFDTEEEAALAYDRAARMHQGKWARLNFPERPD